MSPQTKDSETPLVSTEPQRLALDAMSRELVEKLNRMVEEQNQRVEAFTKLEHSLAQRPMQFTMPTQSPASAEGVTAQHLPEQTKIPQPSPPVPPVAPVPPKRPVPPLPRTLRSPVNQESSSRHHTLSESMRTRPTNARGTAREPGSFDDLLELLGLRRSAKQDGTQRREHPTPATSEGSGMFKAFATFFLLVILFMAIRSCS